MSMRAWWGVTPPPRDWNDNAWRYGRGMPGDWYYERRTYPAAPIAAPIPAPRPVDEERIRKIVREEIADLPIPFDVPDVPPAA